MANPLLEFVLSLVRDPDAAARYAADPERAIADAHLTDVTRVDVNSLIPVVSESMSAGAMDDNVWTSGQAVSAFDAFGDELPVQVTGDEFEPAGREVIDTSDTSGISDFSGISGISDFSGISGISDVSDISAVGIPDRLGAFDDSLDSSDGMPSPAGGPDDAVVAQGWFDDDPGGPAVFGDPGDTGDLGDPGEQPHQAGGFDVFGQ